MSSPEAEGTKSLSNLLKSGWVRINTEEKRIINSDERLVGKLERNQPVTGYAEESDIDSEDGFIGGLAAEPVDALLADSGEGIIREGSVNSGPSKEEERGRELLQQAEEELALAHVEIERQKEAAQADIEVMKRVAGEEARHNGYNDGFAKGTAEIEKLRGNLQEERTKLKQEYDRMVDELEPRFIDLLTGIYEQIFQVELKEYGPIVAHLVANTIRNSDENKNFIVRVAKADYDAVHGRREEIRGNVASGKANLEIIADVTLAPGECLIETGGGVFDCGLGTQLDGLNQKLRLLSFEK